MSKLLLETSVFNDYMKAVVGIAEGKPVEGFDGLGEKARKLFFDVRGRSGNGLENPAEKLGEPIFFLKVLSAARYENQVLQGSDPSEVYKDSNTRIPREESQRFLQEALRMYCRIK